MTLTRTLMYSRFIFVRSVKHTIFHSELVHRLHVKTGIFSKQEYNNHTAVSQREYSRNNTSTGRGYNAFFIIGSVYCYNNKTYSNAFSTFRTGLAYFLSSLFSNFSFNLSCIFSIAEIS